MIGRDADISQFVAIDFRATTICSNVKKDAMALTILEDTRPRQQLGRIGTWLQNKTKMCVLCFLIRYTTMLHAIASLPTFLSYDT